MPQLSIDINCDMGESFGRFTVGNDEAIFPWITSCNIACGFHGGDPLHMEKTIQLALKYGVRIGAHPSYPDLGGFGRRNMQLSRHELKAILKYQISAIKGMSESLGASLEYVKPHGALYNTASKEESEALTIIQAIREIDPHLAFMGLAGSLMERLAREQGIPFIAEAFADRSYEPDGKLMSRNKKGAVIHDPQLSVEQVLSMVKDQLVRTSDGSMYPIQAQSFCIHGDNPTALAILQALHEALHRNGISKSASSL